MNNLFIFVEGDDDKHFVEKILTKLFLSKLINIIPICYQKKRNIEIIKHIHRIRLTKNQDYILLSDFDFQYPCITSRKNKRINEFSNENYDCLDLDKIFIVKLEIESWYISGIDNSLDQFKDFDIPDDTENISKETFDNQLKNSQFSSKLDLLIEISKFYNYKLAISRNKSLKYFLKKLDLIKYI